MSLMTKLRLPDEMLGRPAPSRRQARPGRRRPQKSTGLSPFGHGLVLGVCVGMTFALIIGVVGFLVTRPTGAAPAVAAPAADGQPAADRGARGATGAKEQPAASIDVTAAHLGDLQVRIEARVSAPGTYDPITKGQVVAWTDMVAMPMAHQQGPVVMTEVSGRPGTYQAVIRVQMVGEYNVTVEIRHPMASRADKRIDVQQVRKS
ncbi:hypothetical protein [Sphaerisporangium perillae]|uniref:hypothetical protein n=1 Tax=Sphaerisporangium perillae TaxID=2935860 RepID=UPI00200F2D7F|nr:hypothetical protein [Sphaerisporangium perillae]